MKERYLLWFSITRWSARAVMWDQTTISPCTYLLPQKMVERPQQLRDKLHELSMTARIALSTFVLCRMKIILPDGMNTFATVTIGHTVNKIISEDSKSDGDVYTKTPLRIKNRKKYINRYLQPYTDSVESYDFEEWQEVMCGV